MTIEYTNNGLTNLCTAISVFRKVKQKAIASQGIQGAMSE
ncbi:hypothetical protein cce_2863 [Crocosphaera subtropica ATCC 51142]|uniref:Uncharacterized protein n=1 Tax=Crocosphaera subtropica (strain ATCC 51142 / BH68) TaxID=43989 RepID=B1WV14_CROS5|nr:hypothetical protein cce_2863 [Crocosphaera subtropica ATCC 51142]